jgi:hypothetical protein
MRRGRQRSRKRFRHAILFFRNIVGQPGTNIHTTRNNNHNPRHRWHTLGGRLERTAGQACVATMLPPACRSMTEISLCGSWYALTWTASHTVQKDIPSPILFELRSLSNAQGSKRRSSNQLVVIERNDVALLAPLTSPFNTSIVAPWHFSCAL